MFNSNHVTRLISMQSYVGQNISFWSYRRQTLPLSSSDVAAVSSRRLKSKNSLSAPPPHFCHFGWIPSSPIFRFTRQSRHVFLTVCLHQFSGRLSTFSPHFLPHIFQPQLLQFPKSWMEDLLRNPRKKGRVKAAEPLWAQTVSPSIKHDIKLDRFAAGPFCAAKHFLTAR